MVETRAKETIGIFEDEDDDFLIQATNDKLADDNDEPMDDDNDSDIDIPMSKAKPLPDLDGNIIIIFACIRKKSFKMKYVINLMQIFTIFCLAYNLCHVFVLRPQYLIHVHISGRLFKKIM
jgi:hypothetical protein